jgi:extracellular solute-binding protein
VVALTVLTEVAGQPEVKLVGPLPKELQVPLPYSAVLSAHPSDEMASQAFLQAIASANAKQAYAAAGFGVDK